MVLFSKYGTVVDAEIIFNEKGSKGFGFVSMSNPGEAAYARAVLQGAIVEGRRIDVNPATAKTMPRPVSALHMKPMQQQDVEGQRRLVEAQTRLAELQLALMTLQKDTSQVTSKLWPHFHLVLEHYLSTCRFPLALPTSIASHLHIQQVIIRLA